MIYDSAEHDSLVVEINLLGKDGYSATDLIIGLIAAAVEVAESNGISPDYVLRTAHNVVSYSGGPRYDA